MRPNWGVVRSMGGADTTAAIVRMQASLVSQVCVSVFLLPLNLLSPSKHHSQAPPQLLDYIEEPVWYQ